jgi:hypothetical protein
MRSSNDMYERGVADAEQDELNLFYYQHYYYYRKGYDRARKRMQRPAPEAGPPTRRMLLLAASLIAAVGLLGGLYWLSQPTAPDLFGGGMPAFGSNATPTRTPVPPTPVPEVPSATPLPITTPIPTLAAPVLQVGGQAQVVNVGDAALLVRAQPGIGQPVQARFPEGTQVSLVEGPVEADGFTWWRIQADNVSGWSAQGNPETGVTWLQPQ